MLVVEAQQAGLMVGYSDMDLPELSEDFATKAFIHHLLNPNPFNARLDVYSENKNHRVQQVMSEVDEEWPIPEPWQCLTI